MLVKTASLHLLQEDGVRLQIFYVVEVVQGDQLRR